VKTSKPQSLGRRKWAWCYSCW